MTLQTDMTTALPTEAPRLISQMDAAAAAANAAAGHALLLDGYLRSFLHA